MSGLLILGIIIVILVIYIIGLYNGLVTLKHNIDNAFADIDVQLKQRMDLIPNLVETVKGYATHEQGTLEKVIEARTKYMNAGSLEDKLGASDMLSGALKSLFALSENYPDLKANTNFLQLQSELSDLENKIAAARRYYNSAIKEYNVALESFPSNLIAKNF
jgi:LemA protein